MSPESLRTPKNNSARGSERVGKKGPVHKIIAYNPQRTPERRKSEVGVLEANENERAKESERESRGDSLNTTANRRRYKSRKDGEKEQSTQADNSERELSKLEIPSEVSIVSTGDTPDRIRKSEPRLRRDRLSRADENLEEEYYAVSPDEVRVMANNSIDRQGSNTSILAPFSYATTHDRNQYNNARKR